MTKLVISEKDVIRDDEVSVIVHHLKAGTPWQRIQEERNSVQPLAIFLLGMVSIIMGFTPLTILATGIISFTGFLIPLSYVVGAGTGASLLLFYGMTKTNKKYKCLPKLSEEEFWNALPEKTRAEVLASKRLKELQQEYDKDLEAFGLKYFGATNAELSLALMRGSNHNLIAVVDPNSKTHQELKKLVGSKV